MDVDTPNTQSAAPSEPVVAAQSAAPSAEVPSTAASKAGGIRSDATLPLVTYSSDEQDGLVPTQPLPPALQPPTNPGDSRLPSATSSVLAIAGTPRQGPGVEHGKS